MSDLNQVTLIGRTTKDPELKYTQGGVALTNFSIAVNKTYTANDEKKEQVSFFNCVAWTKLAEVIVQYVKKGHRIGITGRLQQQRWEDDSENKRSSVEIVVENFQFLQPKLGDEDAKSSELLEGETVDNVEGNPFSDSSIPF